MDMRMKLASDIHMDDIQQKLVSKQMIQNGLLEDNLLSTILYLNHHYKTNCVIKNKETDKYYKTGIRNYPTFITVYDNGKWYLEKTKEDHIMYSPITDLSDTCGLYFVNFTILFNSDSIIFFFSFSLISL